MGPEGVVVMLAATWMDSASWGLSTYAGFAAIILLGMELLGWLVLNFPGASKVKRIDIRAKHLDELSRTDLTFIAFNRMVTPLFVYHLVTFCAGPGKASNHVEWSMDKISVMNTAVALPAFFVVYDFVYQAFHRALHHGSIYKYIHKHHHRQKAPSRGNVDAVNVHPFEFVTGEYLHLLAVFIVPCHIVTVVMFIIVGGVMASLNHTRYDVVLPFGLYEVKWHDHHHVVFKTNYSQYTMLWDRVWGTFEDHPANKRHNA